MLKVDERAARPSRCPYCQHLNSVQIERTITGSPPSATFRCSAVWKDRRCKFLRVVTANTAANHDPVAVSGAHTEFSSSPMARRAAF
jgi:hypothetical protein